MKQWIAIILLLTPIAKGGDLCGVKPFQQSGTFVYAGFPPTACSFSLSFKFFTSQHDNDQSSLFERSKWSLSLGPLNSGLFARFYSIDLPKRNPILHQTRGKYTPE